jgi:hypothetical protein
VSTFITAPSHCTACGASIASGHVFCPGCGKQVAMPSAAPLQIVHAKKPALLFRIFAGIGVFVVVCVVLALVFGGGSSTSGTVATPNTAEVHQIGDPVHVGYWSYRVNRFFWSPVVGEGISNMEVADARFIIVDLTIRNEDRTPSTLPRIVLIDTQGREFQTSSKAFLMPGAFDILKDLNPSVESRGLLVFDVPPGQYTIKLSGGIESSESALVDLKQDDAPAKPSAAPTEDVQPPEAQNGQLQPAVNSDPANGDATQTTPEAAPSDVVPASPTDESPANPVQQIAPAQPVAQPN